jgi:hypothetical protein
MSYRVGQHVELRSGKTATVRAAVGTDRYRVELDEGGRLVVPSYDIIRLVGAQPLNLRPGRNAVFVPVDEARLNLRAVRVLGEACDDAIDHLLKAKLKLAELLHLLDDRKEPGPQIRVAAKVCFMLPTDAGREEYRRLIGYVNQVIDAVYRGLTGPSLMVCETDGKALKLANGQMVAGYVPAGVIEGLSMLLWGGSAHQRFKSVAPMSGELHVNVHDFLGMPWQIAATLIHEATHKFCKTIDVHYINAGLCTTAQTFVTLIRTGAPQPGLLEQTERLVGIQDKVLVGFSPAELLNNADSFAYFIMLMGE